MAAWWVLAATAALPCVVVGDQIVREPFEGPARKAPLVRTWGDTPKAVHVNATDKGIGVGGSGAARLVAAFPTDAKHNLSYWTWRLPDRVPLVPQLRTISFRVRTNVPVSIKIGLWPYGFIYHGPGVQASEKWQHVVLPDAYAKLRKWCEGGKRTAEGAWVDSVVVAVGGTRKGRVDLVVDEIVLEGPKGAAKAAADEAFRRRVRKVRIVPISLIWDQGHRTLAHVLAALDEAGLAGADLACLPEACVDQPPEPIPGPASEAIARKAAQYRMYVVANLRERHAAKTTLTSFLCDRAGRIVGRYRKSHRLPYEEGIALGDELPVFATDFGPVGLKIGTDHWFCEIDGVLRRRGAKVVVWSTSPFPVRDEHTITLALRGRAVDHRLYYAVARYAGKAGYGGYPAAFSWTATWPLGRAQVIAPDGHTVADSGHGGGPAVAAIPAGQLQGALTGGGYPAEGKFALITADTLPPGPRRRPTQKRTIRAAAIECEGSFPRLIAKLDACGRLGCDIVCLWEYVWYRTDEEVEKHKARNRQRLAAVAEAAKRNRMYVVIAGELERGFNESILFDRAGKEIGRYTKMNQTTAKTSRYYRAGQKAGVFDLDFGRICTKICADVYSPEIDRVAALHQVDLMLLHTQDAGPCAEHVRLRDARRCVDDGYFLLRAAGQSRQSDHRTYIMDPWGMRLAGSQFRTDNAPVVAVLALDNRPKYYEWPPEARKAGAYPDPWKRDLRPAARGDLRAIILRQRRPGLYRARPEKATPARK